MSYLQSALEYADEWLEFDPTKSRYSIKKPLPLDDNSNKMNVDSDGTNFILPDKDKVDFVTYINNKFMTSPGSPE